MESTCGGTPGRIARPCKFEKKNTLEKIYYSLDIIFPKLFRAEAYHYLCELAVETEKLGLNEYTHEGTSATTKNAAKAAQAAPPVAKVNGSAIKATPKKPVAKVSVPPTKVRT